MTIIAPTLISDHEEQHKWVVEIDEIINHQLEVVDSKTTSVSLFQVPETITQNKPEAYEPQQIGLGPIHHFRPRPYNKMEQKKIAILRKHLNHYGIKDYKLQVLERVRKFVRVVRSCYDMFLQDNDESLARVFAIDGLFLHYLFHTYTTISDSIVDPKKRLVAQDILMVENQIPMIVLKEIHNTLHDSLSSESCISIIDDFSHSVFRIFCEAHSPLKLYSISEDLTFSSDADHLLSYMYLSIVQNGTVQKPPKSDKPSHHRILGEAAGFLSKIPTKEIGEIYEQTLSVLETFSQTEPLIPSASKLRDKAGFQFNILNDDEGIQSINLQELEIYLPTIDLNSDSEVILRNLIAYETLTSNSDRFPLNEYMGLMCALVTNTDDARYLKSCSVIVGELGDDEVAKLFVEISGCIPTVETIGRSRLRIKVIDEINRVYESGLEMKMYLLLKKVAGWLAVVLRAIGGLVESSWKIVAFMVSVVIVLLLVTQASCDVYGCDKKRVS